MQKQKRGNLEKRLPAAGRGDHITIASRGGRDCATVHVSPMRSCSEFISENIQRIFSGIYSSLRKGTKKDPAGGGGNARFFASRPLRQDHGSGSGALEGRGRSFLSVLTSSATVREPPHRPFPSPSDSPPRPRRKHRPCPARVR